MAISLTICITQIPYNPSLCQMLVPYATPLASFGEQHQPKDGGMKQQQLT